MVSIPPSWRPFASLPLRLVVGAALAVAGFVKVFSTLGQANIVYELSALAVPFPGLLGWVVGIAELLCGLALVVGMRTVAASVIMLMNLGGWSRSACIDYPELLADLRLSLSAAQLRGGSRADCSPAGVGHRGAGAALYRSLARIASRRVRPQSVIGERLQPTRRVGAVQS